MSVYDRLKMLPEEHLNKSSKNIRTENELIAESEIIDEKKIMLYEDKGLTINEMLQIIKHRENENCDKTNSKEILKSMQLKG